MNAFLRLVRLSIVGLAFLLPTMRRVSGLPAGFEDENVVQMNEVVDMAFAGNIMLAVTKDGKLYSFDLADADAESKLAADLTDRICSNGERGLGTIAVHPQFETNRWVYLYYTYNRDDPNCPLDYIYGAINRCSRFVMNDDWTLDLASELVLFQSTPLPEKMHNGGDMEFGVDGMLYVTTGDGGIRSNQWAQKLSNMHGSIIRITDSGEIPADNPFTGAGTARCNATGETMESMICQEIFAYGLRNPFRFTMDPHSTDKVRFLVSDVGSRTWEEISVGGTDYAGVNYGWPILEGPCDYNTVDSCAAMDTNDTEFTHPLLWYVHNEEDEACAVGVAVPPPNLDWPSPYNDPSSFFFVDFIFGKIFHVMEDAGQACYTCVPPMHGHRNETFHEWSSPIGLRFGPAPGLASSTALYYTFRDTDIHVKRIVYKGGTNFSPTASFAVSHTNVLTGGTIEFDATNTTDPDHMAAELTYTWNFGDGSFEETGMIVSHQYEEVGVFQVTLVVTDPNGGLGNAMIDISVGAPPSVEIISPAEGTTFAVGDVLTLVGTGSDHLGIPLNESSQLTWEVRQHHANHFHPFLAENTLGNNFTISKAPAPEDFFAAGNSFLEILLTGTDSSGISATVSRNVMPRHVNMSFDSEPTGLLVTLDDEIMKMPHQVLTWENHKLHVNVTTVQGDYVFKGWKDDAVQKGIVTVPSSGDDILQYVAVFKFAGTEETEDIAVPVSVPEAVNPAPRPSPPHAPARSHYYPIIEVVTLRPTRKSIDQTTNSVLEDSDIRLSNSVVDDAEGVTFSSQTDSSIAAGLPVLYWCGFVALVLQMILII